MYIFWKNIRIAMFSVSEMEFKMPLGMHQRNLTESSFVKIRCKSLGIGWPSQSEFAKAERRMWGAVENGHTEET